MASKNKSGFTTAEWAQIQKEVDQRMEAVLQRNMNAVRQPFKGEPVSPIVNLKVSQWLPYIAKNSSPSNAKNFIVRAATRYREKHMFHPQGKFLHHWLAAFMLASYYTNLRPQYFSSGGFNQRREH